MANDSADEPSVLRRRRAIIMGSCTRVRTFADAVQSVTPSMAAQFEERKSKLERYWSDYDAVQTKLEMLDESESNHRVTFEDAFYALSAKLRELLDPASLMRVGATPTSPVSFATAALDSFNHVRLPKLNLPLFSGKYDEWLPFFDTFSAVIHSNTSLSSVQRLQYLKASLIGDASNVISALEISDANYEVAWNLLKERYDNRRIIVQTHIQVILDLPSVTRENPVELRRLADGTTRHLHALQALKRPTSQWDDLLVHIVSRKLDTVTFREWQLSLTGSELPSLKQLINFITHRCQTLESSSRPNIASQGGVITRSQANVKRQSSCVATVKSKCGFCNKDHLIYYCREFLALPISQRVAEIKRRKRCTNCLQAVDHSANKCPSGNCKICKLKHNTLLHIANNTAASDGREAEKQDTTCLPNSPVVLIAQNPSLSNYEHVMLSTAVVYAYDNNGTRRSCRVLLDNGSQVNFISRRFLSVLGLEADSRNSSVSGINKTAAKSSQSVDVRLRSRTNSFGFSLHCLVVDHVTDKIPVYTMKRTAFDVPQNIVLADPQFNVSSEVDILIGGEHFWNLLCVGQVKESKTCPTFQKTRFGWIVAGRLSSSRSSNQGGQSFHASVTNAHLHEQLTKFWQIEDVGESSNNFTVEESNCEQHFLQNVSRTPQGRFIVQLPFKRQARNDLGESRDIALNRLRGLEKRFKRNPQLKSQYSQFMNEYLALGHMRRIDEQSGNDSEGCYLPHHAIFKRASDSSKIRVVFDASSKSSTGISLNDTLLAGPTVQQGLFSILLRFRSFLFALTADIVKMYRQVLVHPSHTRYQRILWRDNSNSEIAAYELVTVTYGTTPASFLATRCLKFLADEGAIEFPNGSTCVGRDFYVDDMLTGADTFEGAKTRRDETINLLRSGAFELSKWASNCPDLLSDLNDQNTDLVTIDNDLESPILGIRWNQFRDTFHFSYKSDDSRDAVSKRVILSEISRLFDPLGLLGPVIVLAKLILQELWKSGLHWDESIPQELHSRWSKLKSQLDDLNQLAIPRCVKSNPNPRSLQIHGFSDASQYAFGACVYVRTNLGNNEYQIELLCSKSRVAPLKTVSLPRLELSAALLLARLIQGVTQSFDTSGMQTFLWTDSTIALNWISSPSRRWSVFVANRVGEIQTLTDPNSWHHVRSADNPADILSRGLNPSDLIESNMWWHGPEFLRLSDDSWPKDDFSCTLEALPERRAVSVNVAIVEHSLINDLLNQQSSLSKACRVLSYCRRLLISRDLRPCTTFVTHQEISAALRSICKIVQKTAFPEEHRALCNNVSLNSTSNILSLSPFRDKDGLIRVGGRLRNSNLDFEACHPILLPRNHILIQRVIETEHIRCAHAGTQATMAAVRQRFWPISLRSITRRIVRKCVICFKNRPVYSEAIMGSLPVGRVTVSRPFTHCGVDYAGPFMLCESKRRNARNHKSYLAIFVCFATKGTHLELVSDLTSDTFIAALKRLVARRGKPSCIYSDNGTTFVRAQRQIKEFFDFLKDDNTQADVRRFLRDHEISWSFIPPNAPHCGGLWEAAVKSAKYHLHRVAGNAHLTFEELQTVFCEIEAVLNSRPITPLSADPNDLAYLSPGHFLVGTTLNGLPYSDLTDVSENRLVRWQRVEQMRQHFWKRWSQEYLHTLQERSKWKGNKGEQLIPGQMVLIRQQGLAPLQWLLGRVEEVHPGADNIVRSATVRTARGLFTRPLSRLAILPFDS